MFILKADKVVCFDTLLQVFILKGLIEALISDDFPVLFTYRNASDAARLPGGHCMRFSPVVVWGAELVSDDSILDGAIARHR